MNLFGSVMFLTGFLAIAIFVILCIVFLMTKYEIELYLVKNPTSKYVYLRDKDKAMNLYKKYVEKGRTVFFRKVRMTVFKIPIIGWILGDEWQVEKTLRARDLKEDRQLMGVDLDKPEFKKKEDVEEQDFDDEVDEYLKSGDEE